MTMLAREFKDFISGTSKEPCRTPPRCTWLYHSAFPLAYVIIDIRQTVWETIADE